MTKDITQLTKLLTEFKEKGYFSESVEKMKTLIFNDFLNVNSKVNDVIPQKLSLFDLDLLDLILEHSEYQSFIGDLFEDADFTKYSERIDDQLEFYLKIYTLLTDFKHTEVDNKEQSNSDDLGEYLYRRMH